MTGVRVLHAPLIAFSSVKELHAPLIDRISLPGGGVWFQHIVKLPVVVKV